MTALRHVRASLRPGSILYFDEFNHRADELRAFDEFLTDSGLTFELFGATADLAHVAFVVVKGSGG